MALHFWDFFIIGTFLIMFLGVGFYFKSRAEKDTASFFLGSRTLPWWLAGTSMVATTFAADTPLAVTELVANHGISGNWLWWNMMAGGIFTTFFFARYWRRANILTDVELLEIRYSGKAARFLRGFKAIYLGIFLNGMIIAWVNLALMTLLQVFFGLEGSVLLLCVALCMLFVAFYSSLSGLIGVIYTDFVQFLAAMTGSIILAVVVVSSPSIGGLMELKAKLPEGTLDFFPRVGSADQGNMSGEVLTITLGSFLAYIGFQWWASWYPGNEPGGGGYIAQRMMSTKNERHSVFSLLLFQIAHYCIRPWPWIIVALCTIILYPDLSEANVKLGYAMAMKAYLPIGLKGLLLAAFLSAYMSTISTQLNWGASYLMNDFYLRYFDTQPNKTVRASRIAVFLIMGISLFITTQIESISGVWQFLIEAGAGLGLVLIVRWFWWRVNAWSEIAATVTPLVAYFVAWQWLDWSFPHSFFFTVGLTTLSWILVTLWTSPDSNEKLHAFYERIHPAGNWKPFVKHNPENRHIVPLMVCWIATLFLGYGLLFAIGNLLFREWQDFAANLLIIIFGWIVLKKAAAQTDIFK
jgi:Na+/proline symporter